MTENTPFAVLGCKQCRDGVGLGMDFTMAFQPIVPALAAKRAPEFKGA